jgi:hypothetical protein
MHTAMVVTRHVDCVCVVFGAVEACVVGFR